MESPSPLPICRSSSEPAMSHKNPKSKKNLKPSLSSALTEDRLRDHNRRPSNSAASPYYKGLTDSGLYLRSLGLSPSRESFVSSSSARSVSSSVLLKIQEWAPSCFFCKKKDGGDPVTVAPAPPKAPPPYPRVGSWDPGLSPRGRTERGSSRISVVQLAEKPLRESDPVPAQLVPGTVIVQPIGTADGAIGTVTADSSMGLKEREYVWAYKYRPRILKEFICNRDQLEEFQEMVNKQQRCHFIFEGPPGVGKRTMVLAYLRDVFGTEKLKTKNELKNIELKGEPITSIDVNVRRSSQHVEVNLSELRGYEKHVIVALINESRAPSNKAVHCDHTNCRAIVLHEADKLSTDAQHYVRWLMEKNKGCNKIFFCCYDASKLQIMKHLCKIVKLQPPSDCEIVEVLEFIAKKEHIELPHHLAKKIARNSKHNLPQAIRSFEASWKSTHSFKEDQEILTGWEEDIANIAGSIVEEQGPKQLYIIRGKLKKLIEHNVSPVFIFNTLILELKKLLDDQFQAKIDALYQEYKIHDNGGTLDAEKSLALSVDGQEDAVDKFNDPRKNVHHFMRIEEFTAKFMSFYKSVISESVGGTNCC